MKGDDGGANEPECEGKLGGTYWEPREAEECKEEADAGADEACAEAEEALPAREGEVGVVVGGALAGAEGDIVACDGVVEAGERVGLGLGWLRVVGHAAGPAELGEVVAKGLFSHGCPGVTVLTAGKHA